MLANHDNGVTASRPWEYAVAGIGTRNMAMINWRTLGRAAARVWQQAMLSALTLEETMVLASTIHAWKMGQN